MKDVQAVLSLEQSLNHDEPHARTTDSPWFTGHEGLWATEQHIDQHKYTVIDHDLMTLSTTTSIFYSPCSENLLRHIPPTSYQQAAPAPQCFTRSLHCNQHPAPPATSSPQEDCDGAATTNRMGLQMPNGTFQSLDTDTRRWLGKAKHIQNWRRFNDGWWLIDDNGW